MKLEQYLDKYRISVDEFSKRTGVQKKSLWHYLAGRRRPSQKSAEAIERESDGLVTVKEMRRYDARNG